MTEQEWLACDWYRPMVEFIFDHPKGNRLSLYVRACSDLWNTFPDEVRKMAIQQAPSYTDETRMREEVEGEFIGWENRTPTSSAEAWTPAHLMSVGILLAQPNRNGHECPTLCNLLRCIFGNPFHPIILNPHWLTPTVTALAALIHEERQFDKMPLLGDALEEAGCDIVDVLKHCRGGGEHVRGCWVVDQVLGKT